MSRTPKKHWVDGRWVTVREQAESMGLTYGQLIRLCNRKGLSLQMVVRMIRDNLLLGRQGRAERYNLVDGKWMTTRQAADMLGIRRQALYVMMKRHGWTLAETVDAYRRGEVRHNGRKAKLHRVGARMMTMDEAAEMLGVNNKTLRCYMWRHNVTLATAVKYYQTKQIRKAEKAILAILKEEPR